MENFHIPTILILIAMFSSQPPAATTHHSQGNDAVLDSRNIFILILSCNNFNVLNFNLITKKTLKKQQFMAIE